MSKESPAPAAAPAADKRPVEEHCARRALSDWDRALVLAHRAYAVGQLVTDEDFDDALAEARGIAFR